MGTTPEEYRREIAMLHDELVGKRIEQRTGRAAAQSAAGLKIKETATLLFFRRIMMWEFLKGKKTYIIAAITFVVGGLQATGTEIPEWVWPLLAALGITFVRTGIKDATKLLLVGILLTAAGCTGLPLSATAQRDLTATLAAVRTLNADCTAGNAAACKESMDLQAAQLAKLAASIDKTDPALAGYVGRYADEDYKSAIRRAAILAETLDGDCQTDPAACRVCVELLVILEDLNKAALGLP